MQLLVRQGHTFPSPAALVAPVIRRHDAPLHPEFFAEAVARFRHALTEGMAVRLGSRSNRVAPALLAIMARRVTERVEPEGFLQFYTELSRLAGCDPSRIAVPLLVVSGTEDPSAPPQDIQELRRCVPDLRVHQSPGLSHFCQVEQAEYVAARLMDFLADIGALTLTPPTARR